MTDEDFRPIPHGIRKLIPSWIRRGAPNWAPNPLAAAALFALEALIVFSLALIGLGVAALALWAF